MSCLLYIYDCLAALSVMLCPLFFCPVLACRCFSNLSCSACCLLLSLCPVLLLHLLPFFLSFLLSCSDCGPSVLFLPVCCLSCHVLSVIVSLLTCCGLWSFFLLLFVLTLCPPVVKFVPVCICLMLPLCPDVVFPPVVVFVPVYLPDVACLSRYGLSSCCSLCVYLSEAASLSRTGLTPCCNLCSCVYVCCCPTCGGCLVFVWPPVAAFVSTFCSLYCCFLAALVSLYIHPSVICLPVCPVVVCLQVVCFVSHKCVKCL